MSRSQIPSVYLIAPPRLVVLSAVTCCIHVFIFSVAARDSVARSLPRWDGGCTDFQSDGVLRIKNDSPDSSKYTEWFYTEASGHLTYIA